VHPAQIAPRTLLRLADNLAAIGAKHYALQEFRADGCASATLTRAAPPSFLSASYCAKIAPKFSSFVVRRAS
jgi:hypothetical protein